MERLGAVGKQSICFISISYLQHSFISLLLRGAPNNSINTLKSYRQLRMKDFPKALRGARVGFEPPTEARHRTYHWATPSHNIDSIVSNTQNNYWQKWSIVFGTYTKLDPALVGLVFVILFRSD